MKFFFRETCSRPGEELFFFFFTQSGEDKLQNKIIEHYETFCCVCDAF